MMRGILNTEIRMPRGIMLDTLWLWFAEGLRNLVPKPLRNMGWKSAYALHRHSDGNEVPQAFIVEKTYFGETRITTEGTFSHTLPISAEIEPDKVFRTTLDLPRAAGRNLKKAIRLRLDEASPISPDQTLFAYQRLPSPQSDRIFVNVAIAKTRTIDDLKGQTESKALHQIGASADDMGRLQFIFEQNRQSDHGRALQRRLRSIGVFILAALAFLGAIDFHLARRMSALEFYETELITQLRDLRGPSALLAEVNPEDAMSLTSGPLGGAFSSLLDIIAATPGGAVIEKARIESDVTTIIGFLPESQSDWSPSTGVLQQSPSDHPGLKRFQLTSEAP